MIKINFLMLSLSIMLATNAHSGVRDAQKLSQVSTDRWRVLCLDGSVEQARTRDILEDTICGGNGGGNSYKSCVEITTNSLPRYEYDTRSELLEITNACSKGGQGTSQCLKVSLRSLPRYEYDTRKEMIQIINSCSPARTTSVGECIELAMKILPTYEHDTKEEVMEINRTCSAGTRNTTDCVRSTISRLPSYEYDTKEELLGIIRSCY